MQPMSIKQTHLQHSTSTAVNFDENKRGGKSKTNPQHVVGGRFKKNAEIVGHGDLVVTNLRSAESARVQ